MNLRSPPRRTLLRATGSMLAVPALAPPWRTARAQAPQAPVLMLRHAATGPGVGDPPGDVLGRCETQRNLSAEGRTQAQALGQRLAKSGARPRALRERLRTLGNDPALREVGVTHQVNITALTGSPIGMGQALWLGWRRDGTIEVRPFDA